jgi:hypothetical protein
MRVRSLTNLSEYTYANCTQEGWLCCRIYFNDHLPPHVHVFKGGGQVRISLGGETERPELIQIEGMSNKDVAKALEIVTEHQLELLEKWKEIHG